MTYQEFLKTKELEKIEAGITVDRNKLNKALFPFQKDIVSWALQKGKAAIFSDCGTGKTIMQLEFANQIHKQVGGKQLVIAPLAVIEQTHKEGKKFGIDVNVCRTHADVVDGINITNYEMLEHFEANAFNAVILDESSILKSFTSSTRNLLIDMFQRVPYKLACTATPSPNDHSELGNHAEFLGIMSRTEMLATYFIHDGGNTSSWRLKGYGEKKFWEWVATWAVCVRNPSDLGYESEGYILPELRLIEYMTESQADEGMLVAKMAQTLSERREARKKSLNDRVDKVKELIEQSDEHWLVWCDYNLESEILHREITGSVEVVGSDSPEYKAEMAMKFADDEIKALVSKPSIYGFGMNFQNCHNIVFCGISDSYEQFYQAIRRCWRYGQKHPVNVHIVLSESEKAVLDNIKKKQAQMDELQANMVSLMHDVTMSEIKHTTRITTEYKPRKELKIAI